LKKTTLALCTRDYLMRLVFDLERASLIDESNGHFLQHRISVLRLV